MRIRSYRTAWDATRNVGSIRFLSENGSWSNWIPYENAQEYQIILMLLQNESPVYHRRNNQGNYVFYTDAEDVGIQG